MDKIKKITIIGGGNMGGAIVEGLIREGSYKPEEITVTRKRTHLLERFNVQGVNTTADNKAAVRNSDIVLIAVKPYLLESVLKEIKDDLKENAIIVSLAVGLSFDKMNEIVGNKVRLFKSVPNIAASLCESMSFIAHQNQSEESVNTVKDFFDKIGTTIIVDDKLLDAVTVSGSCGLAFALRYIRACMQASIEIGVNAQLAKLIVAQTTKGACELILNTDAHPEEEIDKVTTPAGITIVGLTEMEHHGLSSAIIKGHCASFEKLKEK